MLLNIKLKVKQFSKLYQPLPKKALTQNSISPLHNHHIFRTFAQLFQARALRQEMELEIANQ